MKPRLVIATNNAHKLAEITAIVGDRFDILSLADIDCHDDIPETADTLEGNALLKARYVYERYGLDVFADDTGLEVDALDGRPGVHTARYAYPDRHDPEANVVRLLEELHEKNDRRASSRNERGSRYQEIPTVDASKIPPRTSSRRRGRERRTCALLQRNFGVEA